MLNKTITNVQHAMSIIIKYDYIIFDNEYVIRLLITSPLQVPQDY